MPDLAAFTIPDWLGILGSIMVVGAYWGVSNGRLEAKRAPYHLVNLTGAGLLLFSLWFRPNPGSILIEILWAGIAIGALLRIVLGREREE